MAEARIQVSQMPTGGSLDAGQGAFFTLATESGEEFSFRCDPGLLNEFAEKLRIFAGMCHRERLQADPTYQRPGSDRFESVKKVVRWELAFDAESRTVLLGGRHPDGTVTNLPVAERDVDRLSEELRRVRDLMRAIPKRSPN